MKKSPIILIVLALLALVGSTYAANSGVDSVVSNDLSTITVTTETSLISEDPITDVSVSNVVKQDGVVVSESTTSSPVVSSVSEYERISELQDEQFDEFLSIFKTLLPIWIFTMLVSLVGGVFWLIMFIDAIKYQKENQLLWILILLFINLVGAIVYYFVEKHPRDKANKVVEVVSQTASPVIDTPTQTVFDQPSTPVS